MPLTFNDVSLILAEVDLYPLIIPYTDDRGNKRVWGLYASFFDNATAALNISYITRSPVDNNYGEVYANGTASGQLGMLQRGEADVALGPVSPHPLLFERHRISYSMRSERVNIISGMKHLYTTNPFAFFFAFDATTWILIGILLFVVSYLLLKLAQPSTNLLLQNFSDLVLNTLGCLLNVGSHLAPAVLPSGHAGRFLFSIWMLGAFVLSTYFSGVLKSLTAVQTPTTRINKIQDVIRRKKLRYIQGPAPYQEQFRASQNLDHQALLQRHYDTNGRVSFQDWVGSYTLHELAQQRAITLWTCENAAANYANILPDDLRHHYFYCGKQIIMQDNFVGYYSRSIPKHVCDAIDKRIQWLQESGVQFMKEYDKLPPAKNRFINMMAGKTSIMQYTTSTISELRASFILMFALQAIAILVLFGEILFNFIFTQARSTKKRLLATKPTLSLYKLG